MALKIVIVGLVVFFAHFLVLFFRKTRIPDVLLLMLGGIVAGPILGKIHTDDFGAAGPVATTIALIVILFESGSNLKLKTLFSAFGQTMLISIVTWLLTAAIVAVIMYLITPLSPAMCILTGSILGGTSSAVVVPIVDALGLSDKPKTVLFLESALTDVLCIVGAMGMIEAIQSGNLDPGKIGLKVLASFGVAILIGITAGILWALIMGYIRRFPNTIFTTVAWVFVVYGATDLMGFSGAIAALAVGVTMANLPGFRLTTGNNREIRLSDLGHMDRLFFAEAVFLLKTFFFIYLGISLRFDRWLPVLIAILILMPVYLGRIGIIRAMASRKYTRREASIMTLMIPKGLAAAVLATLPVQENLPNAEWIPGVVYMVVLLSIVLTAFMVLLVEKTGVQHLYTALFRKFAETAPIPPLTIPTSESDSGAENFSRAKQDHLTPASALSSDDRSALESWSAKPNPSDPSDPSG